MDIIAKELGISNKNIFCTLSPDLYTVVVHCSWLKKLLKNREVDDTINNVDFVLQPGENVPYPWKKVFIRVLNKRVSKVLPLPRYKLNESSPESPLTFSQLLQYVSQNNHRNLWKESYKKYCQNINTNKESAIVSLNEHDQLLSEVITRLYGCSIVRIKKDESGMLVEYKETIPSKCIIKSYDAHMNLLAALFTLETDNNFFVIYRGHYENNLLDCLNFSPNLIDCNYGRGLFLIYQLLNVLKALNDRGLSIGMLNLQDIYLTENLWLQILPTITNNVHSLDASLIYEQKSRNVSVECFHNNTKEETRSWHDGLVQLEKLCMLWVKGRLSNLDYLLNLNVLAGRSRNDPQAHFLVPWVTDFSMRCGKNWRDLSKSKYRLNKGDRQLDMTYDVPDCLDQIPHHVTEALSDITCYVYLARRTPKEILCKHVRNNWVPAEYPASIQRMNEWTPDECIPEFYTDPTVFKSIHEDLPDLGVPSWATCAEDFISKHREALESTHVSENLHHWIDITFGYKLSGSASVKAKNVCLSLVDGHTNIRRGAMVQLFSAPHPTRRPRAAPPAPPRLHWTTTKDTRKSIKSNDSSDEISEEEEESSSMPQHISRLNVPTQRIRSRHKSSSRARSLSKSLGQDELNNSIESRASSHSRHYRVQRSELGKGVIYLPKEFNPVASIQALESFDNFKTKCFFSKAEQKEKDTESVTLFNRYSSQRDIKIDNLSTGSEETAFTNHMFYASYDQNYLRKVSQEVHKDSHLKERKNRSINTRYTTAAAVYKQFVTESRKQDMLVLGCLIVEIFLHSYIRPLRTAGNDFVNRYNNCRTVLKYNFNHLPKCVSYITSILLNVEPTSLSFRNELIPKKIDQESKIVVTGKGLPPPTSSQLLQPLLMQHLIYFPQHFHTLYKLLTTLHEYELTSNELNILFMYECDGVQCEQYQQIDKTKLYFTQKIAEGKIHACASYLEVLLNEVTTSNQFDVLDLFLTHYIELLKGKDTSVLAAWYLFDTIAKALGPAETKKKLLRHILNLYDDDDFIVNKTEHHKVIDVDTLATLATVSKQKFLKLYHHIFLLQLMVRFGLQCFLDNFTQHLVEAVGGYKDVCTEVVSPGHLCHNKEVANKKPRYSDANLKNALSSTCDIFSPDTSYGSELVVTPGRDKISETAEITKEKDLDNRSENELFHFESDKEGLPSRSSRSKSPASSIDSYVLNAAHETMPSPPPSAEVFSPTAVKEFDSNVRPSTSTDLGLKITNEDSPASPTPSKVPTSPTIDIPTKSSMFTSYLHFTEEEKDTELRKESRVSQIKSLELNRSVGLSLPKVSRSYEDVIQNLKESDPCKISEMSSESLIWLAHKLGPVLTCRFITRNLLKMLTLCYIGKDNLSPWEGDEQDEFKEISIANSRVVGDRNAAKVIESLTSIVAMYGEKLITFQYLPHMSELIASCRRRVSAPLEGGAVACMQLVKHLVPYMCDAELMEQLQDTFLKSLLQPALRLAATSRGTYPSGAAARRALARKLLDALYALAVRVGPEMTRRHLAVPPLQRFFLAFDKASGKTENWPKPDESEAEKISEQESADLRSEGFLEICRDGSTAEWTVRDGRVVRADLPDLACTPPDPCDQMADAVRMTAQEELLVVFNEELAYQAYSKFSKFIGTDCMERSLKNLDTIQVLCQTYEKNNSISSPLRICRQEKRVQMSLSDEPISRRSDVGQRAGVIMDQMSSSNSFGSNVTLVGNRLDVSMDAETSGGQGRGFDVVAYKMDNGLKSSRHLRGDWLIYWEHEIGRPEKDARFNLKQIKLQTFVGHTHTVKSILCLDNENSFMSGSKDKTVRLWSLRNQGDGNATTQCNWTYTGHKKGVLSLSFLESLRLAVSTDSVVHIWDPFMESVVAQLDSIKCAVSIVRALPGPSHSLLAATTDATLKLIDARDASRTHDLKLPSSANTFIRCMSVCESGAWVCVGLASGHVCVLDARTARPRAHWRAHDGEVLRLTAVDDHRLLSSGLDQVTALWSADDGELIAHLKGTTEPVHCLSVYYNELISGTTNNRIGVHTSLGQDASFSSTKLRSDTFKGILTSMAVLPLNRLLLLGSDNGTISLLC